MTRRISILLALMALALPATAPAAKNGPIAFAGGTETQKTGIWAWKDGWRGLRHITALPDNFEGPQGSPDGRWIVFSSQSAIYRARTDGSRVLQVTSGAEFDRAPSFTRSGKRILFSRSEPLPGQPEDVLVPEHIFSVKLDGTGLRQLTFGNFSDREPVFSPNGRIIAFDRKSQTSSRHVFTMRTDGTRVKDATPNLAAWSSEPTFRPDGSRIAFVRSFPGSSTSDVFTMRPDGKGLDRLTGRSGNPLGGVSSPSWSPDGTRIVFGRENRSHSSRLRIIRVRDGRLLQTLGGPRFARSPEMRAPAWLRG